MFEIWEQRSRRRALLLACCIALAGALSVTDAAHAAGRAGATASVVTLAPGAGFDGRHDAAVSRVQSRLSRLGYAPGPVDGLYGPWTTAAVRRLQAANGLAVDGIAGPLTRRALAAQARPEPGRVKAVQRRLRALGHRPGPADGILGPATVRALRRFQAATGIAGATRLTTATLAELELTAPRRRAASPPPATTPAPAAAEPVVTPDVTQPPVSTPAPADAPRPQVVVPAPGVAGGGAVIPSAPSATPVAPDAIRPPDGATQPEPIAGNTPDPVTAAPRPARAAAASVTAAPPPSAPPAPTRQSARTSGSLTLQIAVIVGVMLAIALWPFRRYDDAADSRDRQDSRIPPDTDA